MPDDAQKSNAQSFEQITATIFTCRSVVKYNLTLSDDQKKELLADIDTALEVLRSHLITPPPVHTEDVAPPPSHLFPLFDTDEIARQNVRPDPATEKQTLQVLYRMYHAYLDEKQSSNIYTFVERFNDVMSTLNHIQYDSQYSYGSYVRQDLTKSLLQRLQQFVADLYSIFMDFFHLLSDVLQQNNVYLDTEKLSPQRGTRPLQEERIKYESGSADSHDLAPLFYVYDTHQQLNRIKGQLTNRVSEGTAFLDFLRKRMDTTMHVHEDVMVQYTNVTDLLFEMSILLAEYDKATSTLFLTKG